MKSKRTKAMEINPKVRKEVKERDFNICIICGCRQGVQVMHYIGRGAGGLGIPQNLGMGCVQCHMEMDQGLKKKEHLKVFRDYLTRIYPNWDESKLRYRKH